MTATAERVAAVLDRYEAVIGIEIHCQLKTASKMFCGCSTAYDGRRRRTRTSARSASACPGALPVINRRAVEFVIATGIAIEAARSRSGPSGSARTTSTPTCPRATRSASTRSRWRRARPARDRDLGRPVHGADHAGAPRGGHGQARPRRHAPAPTAARTTLVDFNRSGAPLMEIVTEPDIRTAEQARRYAEELQLLLRAIGASDADMERGQMRVEANVSLRPRGVRGVRDAGRGQEHELVPGGGAGDRLRDRAPGRDARRRRDARRWRRAAGTTGGRRPTGCAPRRRPTTTATSRSRTCRRSTSRPAWIAGVRSTLPELPAARRARYEDLGHHRTTTPR